MRLRVAQVQRRRLISVLSRGSALATMLPGNVVGRDYFALSGTSMAAGVASGAAALVFQAHPDWSPSPVKLALAQSSMPVPGNATVRVAAVDRAVVVKSPPADTTYAIKPNYQLLQAAGVSDPANVSWDKISWGSISWGTVGE